MKIFLLLGLCFFFSCSPHYYQYLTITGTETSKNEQRELIFENDVVRVVYRFNQARGPMSIFIYNKTDQSIEIDWQRSALIRDDRSQSYFSPNLASATEMSDEQSGVSMTPAALNVNGYVAEAVQYIPPRSGVLKFSMDLDMLPIQDFSFKSLPLLTYASSTKHKFTYKKFGFSAAGSPVQFRNYLTFVVAPGHEFVLDHHFYVSEIWQSAYFPAVLPREITSRGDFVHF